MADEIGTESEEEFAAGPAMKFLVVRAEVAAQEVQQNGMTPTLDRPYPALHLLWQRIRPQATLSDSVAATKLIHGWHDLDTKYRGRHRSSFLHMMADEAFERMQLIEDFLAASGITSLKQHEPDSPKHYLTRAEQAISGG